MDLINKYLKEQTPGYEYEYNYEGDMAKTQLNMMIDASMELKSMLANDTNLPEWVQSKITKAADYIDSARDYMKNMNKDSNGSMGEDVERKDTGWQKAQTDRKDQYGNRIKNVARRLARQGMQAAVKDLKKGPEAGKRQVEEVELDELKRSTIRSYGDKRIRDLEGDKSVEAPFRPKPKSFSNPKRDAISTGLVRAAARLSGVKPTQKEEVELDELKEPTVQKYITRAKFSTNPKRRAMAQKAQSKLLQKPNPMKTEEVKQISELKPRTLASYTSKAADQMAHAAIDKSTGAAMGTMGRMSDMPDLAKQGTDKEDKAFQTILKRTKGITSASRRLAKEEAELGEELSSSQRDTHFSLMNKHSLLAKSAKGANKDAHRMAALDHQMALRNPENSQSRSKALSLSNKLGVKEDADLISKYTKLGEAKYPGFRVRMTPGVSKLPRRGYGYVPQGDQDPRTGMPLGFSPAKEEPKKAEPPKKTS